MAYCIKKRMVTKKGKVTHILLTDGYSEILEYTSKFDAENIVKILNTNSDSGWSYEVLDIQLPKYEPDTK